METTGSQKQWIHCPICHGKTRVMVSEDTVLYNFPLVVNRFCEEMRRYATRAICKQYIAFFSGLKRNARDDVQRKHVIEYVTDSALAVYQRW